MWRVFPEALRCQVNVESKKFQVDHSQNRAAELVEEDSFRQLELELFF